MQVVLDEVISNVMKYAWPGGGAHELSVSVTAQPAALEIEVVDDGKAFDPLFAPAPPARPPLTIAESHNGEVCVVALSGRIDSTNAEELMGRLNTLLSSGERNILVDLKGVIYLTSAAFRALLVAADEAERKAARFVLCSWVGAFALAGTPKPIVDKLNAEIQAMLRIPDIAQKLKAHALDPMFMTTDQFAQRLRSDYDKYGKVIKLAGATVD